MALTSVSICNMALTRIGANRISSLTQDTENARIANLIYDFIVDGVLASYAWPCASTRARLAQLTSTPAYEYAYQYQLPSNPYCLKPLSIYPTGDYKVEGRLLLANQTEVYLRYIGRLTSASDFSPYVARTLIAKLAIEFSGRVANALNLKRTLETEYNIAFARAKMAAGQSGYPGDEGNNDWIDAGR